MSVSLKRFINKLIDRHNFTYDRYIDFLLAISQYKVLTLNEFRNYHNDKEVVICIRHDIDSKFIKTARMTQVEEAVGIRSSLFYLHTAPYYANKKLYHNLKSIQDRGFEIGLHNNLMSIDSPGGFLCEELERLRANGIEIHGSAAHGRKGYKKDGIHNNDFWKYYPKSFYELEYEAYSLDHNKYFSDCKFIDGHRWHPGMFNWNRLTPGDRVQILIHPEHWQ